MKNVSRRSAIVIVLAAIVVSGSIGTVRYFGLRRQREAQGTTPIGDKIHVPRWLQPSAVRHHARFASLWDGPDPLERLRRVERLDAVVAGAASDEDRARRLLHWTRSLFQPGTPHPYPPPDALTTLSEIRAGHTGGFCAQYSFVLVQALQSFGRPARLVTLAGHEVVETWLLDQSRWTMLDPLFDVQIVDAAGRSLSAIEIREARHARAAVAATEGHRLTEPLPHYLARYERIGIWIRNAFTSAPVNFADFDRYRVWILPDDERSLPSDSLRTTHPEDLYGPPRDFPGSAAPVVSD